jgi:hypothetical protein
MTCCRADRYVVMLVPSIAFGFGLESVCLYSAREHGKDSGLASWLQVPSHKPAQHVHAGVPLSIGACHCYAPIRSIGTIYA